MKLTSPDFEDGGSLPLKYSRDGEGASPPLRWEDVPEGTRELALVFENVTPENRPPFVQWVVYRIPADARALPPDLGHARQPDPELGAVHGKNDLANVGYDGPQGTVGRTFRYRFRLFALEEPLDDLPPGLEFSDLFDRMDGHVIEEADLHVDFERPRSRA